MALTFALTMVLSGASATAAPSTNAQLQTAQQQASTARTRMDRMRADLASEMSRYDASSGRLAATRAEIARATAPASR